MDLIIAAALLSAAVIVSVFVLLAVRRPVEPLWASEFLVANFWCVAIVALIAFAVCFGARFALNLKSVPLSLGEIALVAGIATASVVVLRLMAPRRRLAEYAAQIAAGSETADKPAAANVIDFAARAENRAQSADANMNKVA